MTIEPPPGRPRNWDGQRWLEWDGEHWLITEPAVSPVAAATPGWSSTATDADMPTPLSRTPDPPDPNIQWDGSRWVHWTGTQWAAVQPRINPLAFVSMLFGLATIVTLGLSGLIALPLGIVALKQIRRAGERGRPMAIVGVVLGALGCVGVAYLIVLGVFGLHD